ncbi:glycoside hydrolase family 18 protein [Plicaturopsis crispa FD-325 SS-3]|nr:glycoside hydrolase family 18 protein [Plicaturopsis crispa FD-325 SS-3]
MAYYPDWTGKEFPPENVDFTRFDWIDFAFGVPDQSFNVTWDDPKGAPDLLRRLVQAAHANGKKVKLSVGGWSGSTYFSPAVATDQSRRIFANNILNTYNAFGLDGIDIDWEYPGQQGDGMNQVSPTDTPNFLAFLRLLRLVLPKGAKITAATQTSPFADANGNPIGNASQFGKVLDWILLMNYDVWGSSTMPGPNAPLSDGCGNSTQPGSNAVSAYGAWTNAGFPANKLVLGVPSYGYVSKSKATGLRQRSSHHQLARRAVHVANDDGSMTDGQVQVRSLISQGALIRTGGPQQFGGAHGFTRYWDGCSSTPFLRSSGASQVISYDDPESLGMKASFVKKVGMLGVNMFDVHGDTDQWDLTDSLRRGLGLIQ